MESVLTFVWTAAKANVCEVTVLFILALLCGGDRGGRSRETMNMGLAFSTLCGVAWFIIAVALSLVRHLL